MELVDSHCHLNFEPLAGDVDGVIGRAQRVGVTRIVVPAYDLASWPRVERLATRDGVSAALGLHPWCAHEPLELAHLKFALGSAVAVGEIGLDFKVDGADPGRQLEIFVRQVEMAVALDLPVILHCRGAFEEMLADLAPFAPRLKGVVHAYSRGPDLVQRFVDLGLHVAFGGAVTWPRARRARRSAQVVPFDRLLLETDAPSIGLDGVPPEETEPCHVLEVARAVAELRATDVATVAAQTTDNACALFGL